MPQLKKYLWNRGILAEKYCKVELEMSMRNSPMKQRRKARGGLTVDLLFSIKLGITQLLATHLNYYLSY